jgi:hypothetical protein
LSPDVVVVAIPHNPTGQPGNFAGFGSMIFRIWQVLQRSATKMTSRGRSQIRERQSVFVRSHSGVMIAPLPTVPWANPAFGIDGE